MPRLRGRGDGGWSKAGQDAPPTGRVNDLTHYTESVIMRINIIRIRRGWVSQRLIGSIKENFEEKTESTADIRAT